MELLEGRSLTTEIEEAGFVPVPRAVDIATQVADALEAVHEAGIVHRDMKPDNIFLTRRAGKDDYVKLLDFGVAKLLDEVIGEKPLHQTGVGAILGTPEYMSPEQAGGKGVDLRTDVYSLGVILYEMLTGRKPFQAKSYGEMVIKHITVAPIPPSQLDDAPQAVPEGLESLLLACLAKQPAKRPQGMKEIRERLLELRPAAEEAVTLPPPRRRSRGRTWAWALALLVATGVPLGLALHLGWIDLGGGTTRADAGVIQPAPDAGPPPVAKKVEIAFESEPPGAEVFEPGGQDPLGKTPFSVKLEKNEAPRDFVFRLAAHQPVTRRVSLASQSRVTVTMTKLADASVSHANPGKDPDGKKKKKRRRRRRKKRVDKPPGKDPEEMDPGGTIDPFKDQ
jgi:serine/threonine-protein kinase